MFRCFCKY